jgi:hypothetical protein
MSLTDGSRRRLDEDGKDVLAPGVVHLPEQPGHVLPGGSDVAVVVLLQADRHARLLGPPA